MQGRKQDYDHPEVDLTPEEAHGGRCTAPPATVLRTTEAQTALVGFIQDRTDAAGLSRVGGSVQHTAAVTAVFANLFGDRLVDLKQ